MTEDQAFDYLYDRAARHDITVEELMDITPDSVADDYVQAAEFWDERDISHIKPQSLYPSLANDPNNMMPEDPSDNRARGAEVMTSEEIEAAHLDNEVLAAEIDAEVIDYFFAFA